VKQMTWVVALDDGEFMTECRLCKRPHLRGPDPNAAPKRRFATRDEAKDYCLKHEESAWHRKQVARALDTTPTAEELQLREIFGEAQPQPCLSCGRFHKAAVGCRVPMFSDGN
jgi:hypothetical protein